MSKALRICSGKTTEKERSRHGKGQLRDTLKLGSWLFSSKEGCAGKKVADETILLAFKENWSLAKLLRKLGVKGMMTRSGVQSLPAGTLPNKSEMVCFNVIVDI